MGLVLYTAADREVVSMERYIWESERDMQAVINSLIAQTEKPNFFDRILPSTDLAVFKYKYVGKDECEFSLYYYFALYKFSYQPAPFYGAISETKDGCTIEISPLRLVTTAGYIIPAFGTVCYISAIGLTVFGNAYWIPIAILLCGLGTLMLARFLSTRKKWLSRNILFDMIDRAANAKRRQV